MNKIIGFVAAMFISTPAIAEDSRYAMFYDMGYVYALAEYCDFAGQWRANVGNIDVSKVESNVFIEGYYNGIDSIENSGAAGPFCVASYDLYWTVYGDY